MVHELGIGGCERDLSKMARYLDRSLFTPHVACFHSEGLRTQELRDAGIPILHLPIRSFLSYSAIRGARMMGRYLKENEISIVHAYDVPTVIFGVPVARAYGVPAVIATQLAYRDLFRRSYQKLLRLTDRLAHCVVVNSAAVRKHLIEDEHVPPSRVFLSYNGVETRSFHPGIARRQVFEQGQLVIGTLCALRSEKRIDVLMRAFAVVRQARPDIKLLVVGSGPMLESLQALRTELGLEPHCRFEPATADVAPWLRALDVFVIPSESESFPNALLEAMACGCCVIGSRIGGIPELIEDGQSGLLFQSGNIQELAAKLRLVVDDAALRGRLAQAAARTAHDRFSMEIAARRTESLYKALLSGGNVSIDDAT